MFPFESGGFARGSRTFTSSQNFLELFRASRLLGAAQRRSEPLRAAQSRPEPRRAAQSRAEPPRAAQSRSEPLRAAQCRSKSLFKKAVLGDTELCVTGALYHLTLICSTPCMSMHGFRLVCI